MGGKDINKVQDTYGVSNRFPTFFSLSFSLSSPACFQGNMSEDWVPPKDWSETSSLPPQPSMPDQLCGADFGSCDHTCSHDNSIEGSRWVYQRGEQWTRAKTETGGKKTKMRTGENWGQPHLQKSKAIILPFSCSESARGSQVAILIRTDILYLAQSEKLYARTPPWLCSTHPKVMVPISHTKPMFMVRTSSGAKVVVVHP